MAITKQMNIKNRAYYIYIEMIKLVTYLQNSWFY